MPSIFPKTHKEGKQLASAKDEQTHFLSVCFGAWSFSCCQHSGSLSANSNGTKVTWFEQIPWVAIQKSHQQKKVLIFRKFLIATLTASQSGSTIRDEKTSVIQSALVSKKKNVFQGWNIIVHSLKMYSVSQVSMWTNLWIFTYTLFQDSMMVHDLWPIEKFLQPVLHKMLLKVSEYYEN